MMRRQPGGAQEAIRRQSGGDQEAIRRRSGGNEEALRRRSGGDQEAIRTQSGRNQDAIRTQSGALSKQAHLWHDEQVRAAAVVEGGHRRLGGPSRRGGLRDGRRSLLGRLAALDGHGACLRCVEHRL